MLSPTCNLAATALSNSTSHASHFKGKRGNGALGGMKPVYASISNSLTLLLTLKMGDGFGTVDSVGVNNPSSSPTEFVSSGMSNIQLISEANMMMMDECGRD